MKKQLLAIGLSGLMLGCVLATGCSTLQDNNDEYDSTKTNITIMNYGGGIGSEWLRNAASRFEKSVETKTYEAGTTGVKIHIEPTRTQDFVNMASSSYNIYFTQKVGDLSELAQAGKLLNINDLVVDKLDALIYPEVLESLKGNDGNYYGLPHYEIYPGVAYDVETFDKYGYYFARADVNVAEDPVIEYDGDYGTALFTKDDDYKSCGPDGKYGTNDDGLPSSLEELIKLCAYVDSNLQYPISISGENLNYGNYLLGALWNSLAGYDQMKAVYQLKADSVEIVKVDGTGNVILTSENAFEGINYVKKPETEWVQINESNAYLTSRMVSKYYAFSFAEILKKEGWWSPDYTDAECSHIGAQKNFIYGGVNVGNGAQTRTAMLVDGTYWYNEAKENNTISDYMSDAKTDSEKKVAWMTLPTMVYGTQEALSDEAEAIEYSLIDYGNGFSFINANISDNEKLVEACKDFLAFCYSENELKEFTITTGVTRPISYSLNDEDESKMSYYNARLWKLRDNAKVLYYSAIPETATTFKKVRGLLQINLAECQPLMVNNFASGYIGVLKTNNLSAATAIKERFITEATWNGLLNA